MWTRSFPLKINMRSDLEENWRWKNIVPRSGEILFSATPDGDIEFKIGDGHRTYDQLPRPSMHNLPEKTYLYFQPGGNSQRCECNLISAEVMKAWMAEYDHKPQEESGVTL